MNNMKVNLPSINFGHYFRRSHCGVVLTVVDVGEDPLDQVVLECPFDELMKEIRKLELQDNDPDFKPEQ